MKTWIAVGKTNSDLGRTRNEKNLPSVASFLFAFYLSAGYYKSSLIRFIPIDITVLFLVITVFLSLIILHRRGYKINKSIVFPVAIFGILICLMLLSLLYTPSENYAYDKLLRFFFITLWCFFGVFFCVRDEKSLKSFFSGLILVGFIMSIPGLYNFFQNRNGSYMFITALGSNYIALGRAASLGAMILLVYFVFCKHSKMRSLLFLAGSLFFIFITSISGGRLPLMCLLFVIMLIPLFLLKNKKNKLIISSKSIQFILLSVCLCIVFFYTYSVGGLNTFIYRLGFLEDQGRIVRFIVAFEMFSHNIFGAGIGSFPIYYSGNDSEDYPHNLYLELLSELGVVGFMCMVLLTVVAFYNGVIKYKKNKGSYNYLQIIVILGFLYYFITMMISGSINNTKFFYPFLALMLLSPYLSEQERIMRTNVQYQKNLVGSEGKGNLDAQSKIK